MNIKTPFRKLQKKTFPFYLLLALFLTNYILNVSFVVKDSLESEKEMAITFLALGGWVFLLYIICVCSNPGYLRPDQNKFIKT